MADARSPSRAGRPAGPVEPQRRFAGRTALAFAVAGLAAALFVVVLVLVENSATVVLDADRDTTNALHRFALSHRGFTTFMKWVSDSGTTVAWLAILAVVAIPLLITRRFRLAMFAAVTGIGSSLLNNLIKLAVHRARPHLVDPLVAPSGSSFPSGHAQAAVVGYGLLVVIALPLISAALRPWLVGLAVVMTLLVGFSRVALGAHYLSDVLGAYLIGTVWLLGMVGAFRAWRREEGRTGTAAGGGVT
jgi:membrane-associated phospholipid phosphatase